MKTRPMDFSSDHYSETAVTKGYSSAMGVSISWSKKPLGHVKEESVVGAHVETLIEILIDRLEFFQSDEEFKCPKYDMAILHLSLALDCLLSEAGSRAKELGS